MLSSVNALTLEDSRKSLANIVRRFLNLVEYNDVEAQLAFYIDARAALATLNDILIHLIHSVNRLAVKLEKNSHGHHSRKSTAQSKACLAYCIVTIPSVSDVTMR